MHKLSVSGVEPVTVGSLVQFSVASNVVTAKPLPGVISIYATLLEAVCHKLVPTVPPAKFPFVGVAE